jgi:hypothetical protein
LATIYKEEGNGFTTSSNAVLSVNRCVYLFTVFLGILMNKHKILPQNTQN